VGDFYQISGPIGRNEDRILFSSCSKKVFQMGLVPLGQNIPGQIINKGWLHTMGVEKTPFPESVGIIYLHPVEKNGPLGGIGKGGKKSKGFC
jgi:hypothetical protein